MEALQYLGGDDSRSATVVTGQKTGCNDSCPAAEG